MRRSKSFSDIEQAPDCGRNVLEREVFEDQREVRPSRRKEVDVRRLREAPGRELDRPDVGSARVDVLQVGEHEAVLEAVQERARETFVRGEPGHSQFKAIGR